LKLRADPHVQDIVGEEIRGLDTQVARGLEDDGENNRQAELRAIRELSVAILSLVGIHPICRGQEGIATTGGCTAVDIFIACGVNDRDVQEDEALSRLKADIGFPGAHAQDQMGLRGGDFL
jgi:hypothetical protein